MIREKIFRLHRHKSSAGIVDASAHKFDFTFSNIQAIQNASPRDETLLSIMWRRLTSKRCGTILKIFIILCYILLMVPKGWDKLTLSLNSSENGKAVRKSGKGLVKNGTCQWTETISESIWISKFDGSKDPEQHLFTFLVTMGSSRSGVLGQATLDLASFLSSEVPVSVSLPLKKCNFGTTLQVEVKCLTPKTNIRDRKWNSMHEQIDENERQEDLENKSEVSDGMFTKSVESCSTNKFGSASRPREQGSQDTSFSASGYSFDSKDDSIGRQSFSSQSNLNGSNNTVVRQDSVDSHDSASFCSYSTFDSPNSDRSLQNLTFKDIQSKNQREELRKLSHATSLSLQRDSSSSNMFKEVNDGTGQELKAEARMWEQNARKLRVDVETLRKELDDQCLNMTTLSIEHAKSRLECQQLTQEIEHLKSLLEEESVKQDGRGNFGLDGNMRNDMWKELENEIRFQKELSESLSLQLNKTQESNIELISVLQDMEETIEKQKMEIEFLSVLKPEHEDNSAKNIDDEIPQVDICNLELEMLNLQELSRNFQGDIMYLESTLEDKICMTEIEQELKNQFLKEYKVEFISRLAAKEREITKLEVALSGALNNENLSDTRGCADSSKETEHLKKKVQALETDCHDLTEENLELLFELKESRKSMSEGSDADRSYPRNRSIDEYTGKMDHKVPFERKSGTNLSNIYMSSFVELPKISSEKLTFDDQSLSEEILSCNSMILEPHVGSFKKEKQIEVLNYDKSGLKYQDNCEIIKKDSDVSDDKIQVMWSNHLSDLEEENEYLSQRISGLEAQLRYLSESKESSRLELQQREFLVTTLQNEIIRLEEGIESQKLDMNHKVLDMKKLLSEAQEECLNLSKVNIRLQATSESLIEEYDLMQKLNDELREQKLKLQDKCMVLEAQVRRFQDSLCNCSENNRTLDIPFSLIEEENIGNGKTPDSKIAYERRSSGTEAEMHYSSSLHEVKENLETSRRENKVIRAANEEKLMKLFANVMNNEEKRKAIIDELESSLKLSEVERLRLAEENSILQMQSERVPELQNEVLSLRLSLKEMKSQYQMLESLLNSVSDDYEGLKSERDSMFHKISSLQKTVAETENLQRKNIALEEKILRLEGDLIAREALCSRGSETNNELNQIKRANTQLQIKVKRLEDVREKLLWKVHTLEEEQKQTRHARGSQEVSTSTYVQNHGTETTQKLKLPKTPRTHECSEFQENRALKQQPPQVPNKQDNCCQRSKDPEMDCESRIQVLERELAKTLEANDMYKLQLQTAQEVVFEKPKSTQITDSAENKQKIALLEEELHEIRERYLQISLKYAEVEDQREQLVIKLKTLNGLGSFTHI